MDKQQGPTDRPHDTHVITRLHIEHSRMSMGVAEPNGFPDRAAYASLWKHGQLTTDSSKTQLTQPTEGTWLKFVETPDDTKEQKSETWTFLFGSPNNVLLTTSMRICNPSLVCRIACRRRDAVHESHLLPRALTRTHTDSPAARTALTRERRTAPAADSCSASTVYSPRAESGWRNQHSTVGDAVTV
eukprot:1039962-Prymnesium_polylepis.1